MGGYNAEEGLLSSDFEYVPYLDPFFKSDPFFEGREFEEYHEVNLKIYEYLKSIKINPSAKGDFWLPLVFFNFLYEQLGIIRKYPNHPFKIVAHLQSLKLEDLQLYVLLTAIQQFYFTIKPITIDMLDNGKMDLKRVRASNIAFRICLDIIRREFSCLHDDYSVKQNKFIFLIEDIKECVEISKDSEERIENTNEWRNCYQQLVSRHPNLYVNDEGKFVIQCGLLAKQIQKHQAKKFIYFKIATPIDIPNFDLSALLEEPVITKSKTVTPRIVGDLASIFINPLQVPTFIKLLRTKRYINEKNNMWKGNPNNIAILLSVLLEKKLLKIYDKTNIGRILCAEFGIDITEQLESLFRKRKKGKGEREELELICDTLKGMNLT